VNWRKYSTYVGPVGFFGTDRVFRHVVGHIVKTPVIVEGRRPVTLTIAQPDQDHAGLLIVGDQHPFAEIRFIPCRGHARTAWPAGFKLPGNKLVRAPVSVLVHVEGRPVMRMEVGRA
jgi:hypothetical protein